MECDSSGSTDGCFSTVVLLSPQRFSAHVMHSRLFPKKNTFLYSIDYYLIPMECIYNGVLDRYFAVNRLGVFSFRETDYGDGKGDLRQWMNDVLTQYDLTNIVDHIHLICLPRILGYVFNPVCFWLLYDKKDRLRSILLEINNTYKEKHFYLCYNESYREIEEEDKLKAKKIFHISPFLKREGYYEIQFKNFSVMNISINYFDSDGCCQLLTYLKGTLLPLKLRDLYSRFYKWLWLSFKVIFLIHWQALRLFLKGEPFLEKPDQLDTCFSSSEKNENRD